MRRHVERDVRAGQSGDAKCTLGIGRRALCAAGHGDLHAGNRLAGAGDAYASGHGIVLRLRRPGCRGYRDGCKQQRDGGRSEH
jgi:hypothetical protein